MSALVLASTSPRRARLLEEAGIPFTALDPGVSDLQEDDLAAAWARAGCTPADSSRRLAVVKALAAGRRAPPGAKRVLAADTVVTIDGKALGKPRDRAHARSMIELLAGRVHEVATGVALLDLETGALQALVETSRVAFHPVKEAELERFLASDAWKGKAGAYGVQDEEAAPLVAAVEGSRSNVVGLPVERVRELLAGKRRGGTSARVGKGTVAGLLLLLGALAGCPSQGGTPVAGDEKPDPVNAHRKPDVAPAASPGQGAPPPGAFVPDVDDGRPSSGLPETTLRIKGLAIRAEVVTTDPARHLGLMHRERLDDDRGMLFVFPLAGKEFHSFWMKNTLVPLSIAYLRDDGTIVNVEDMEPRTLEGHHSREKVRLALEMNRGWFRIHGLGPGDRVEGVEDWLSRGE